MMIGFRGDIYIKNRQGLTPLTLAAKFARIEVALYNEMNFIIFYLDHYFLF